MEAVHAQAEELAKRVTSSFLRVWNAVFGVHDRLDS